MKDRTMNEVTDNELKKVIADFLEMGHVDNIIAMFRREPSYFAWTGELLSDERFNVRLGLTIVFEDLQHINGVDLNLATPSLATLLNDESPLLRGEAIGILGIIGTDEARELINTRRKDSSPQVREMVELALMEE